MFICIVTFIVLSYTNVVLTRSVNIINYWNDVINPETIEGTNMFNLKDYTSKQALLKRLYYDIEKGPSEETEVKLVTLKEPLQEEEEKAIRFYYKIDNKPSIETEVKFVLKDPLPEVNIKQLHYRISKAKCLNYLKQFQFRATTRILGGREAKEGELPHMGLLGYNKSGKWVYECGSFLISEKFVVTATHCVNKKKPYFVRLGVEEREMINGRDPVDVHIVNIKKNPYHDVALLKLEKKIEFNKFVRPACIGRIPGVKYAIVSGWGSTTTDVTDIDKADKLKIAVVKIMNFKYCKKMYRIKAMNISSLEDKICASSLDADACQGDSGGPLQVKLSNTEFPMYNVIGVIANGDKTCGSQIPTLYTDINKVIDWIERHVWEKEWQCLKICQKKKGKCRRRWYQEHCLNERRKKIHRRCDTICKGQRCIKHCKGRRRH